MTHGGRASSAAERSSSLVPLNGSLARIVAPAASSSAARIVWYSATRPVSLDANALVSGTVGLQLGGCGIDARLDVESADGVAPETPSSESRVATGEHRGVRAAGAELNQASGGRQARASATCRRRVGLHLFVAVRQPVRYGRRPAARPPRAARGRSGCVRVALALRGDAYNLPFRFRR